MDEADETNGGRGLAHSGNAVKDFSAWKLGFAKKPEYEKKPDSSTTN
jgi:hypothetical protein